MKKRKLSGTAREALVLFGIMVVAVLVYNTWNYCCGQCAVNNFMAIGPAGLALVGVNAAAFAVLVFLRLRRRRNTSSHNCSCGTSLVSDWLYCPDCGRSSGAPAP